MAATRLTDYLKSELDKKLASKAAKALVAYIEFFRTHGTGELMKRYPDDDTFGGYDNIVRRAHELAEQLEGFDKSGRERRAANRVAA